jgi:hypothetical protein
MTERIENLDHVIVRAADRARLAPSIHNTQPWRLRLTPDTLEIYADHSRRLDVLDPRGRQLTISCGAALFNARASIAADGWSPVVDRLPDPADPTLLARVTLGPQRGWLPIAALDEYVAARRTNRRAFLPTSVPADVLDLLIEAAAAEDTELVSISSVTHRRLTAALMREADELENADPAYRAELLAWTTDDPSRRDGVQARTVPYLAPEQTISVDPVPLRSFEPHPSRLSGALPLRAFDARQMGWLPAANHVPGDECLLLFVARRDDPGAWLRTGEALQRVWLEITRKGLWASPVTQVVEVKRTHHALRAGLGLRSYPELLLRAGRAPSVDASPRRDLADLLLDAPAFAVDG